MQRLLKDAQALTGVKYDIDNLADVYSAIHAIQENLGIAGTTAKEAEKTITGSANMMKAAWQNVLSAIAGGGDLDRAINNLVYSVSKYFENIVPVVQRSLIGIGDLIEKIAPLLIQNVASALIQAIPSLINAIYQMIVGLAKGIWQGIKALFTGSSGNVVADITTSLDGASSTMSDASAGAESLGDALEETGDKAEKASKQAKKVIASFDDLQTISTSLSGSGGLGSIADEIGGVMASAGAVSSQMTIVSEDDSQISFLDEILAKTEAIRNVFMSGFWQGFQNADFSRISTALDGISQTWSEIFSSTEISNAVTQFVEALIFSLGETAGSLASIGTTIATNLVGGFDIYLQNNKQYLQNSIAGLFDVSASLSLAVSNMWSTFADLFSAFASTEGQELTASVLTLFSTLGLTIVNFGIDAGANFMSAMTKAITDKKDELKQGLQNLLKAFSDFLKNLTKKFADTWNNIEKSLKDSVTNLGETFGQMLTDFLTAVNTWGPQLLEAWSKTFDDIWDDLSIGIEGATKIWEDFTSILQKLWSDHGAKLLEDVGEFSTNLTKNFQNIYDKILSPIIQPLLENMSWLWDDHLSKTIESVGGFVAKLADGAMDMYNTFAVPIQTFIQNVISPAWSFLSENIIGSFGTALAFLTDGISNITNLFGGLIDWITGTFTGNWKKAWEGVKTVFKTVADGFVSIFKLPINRMIDLLNGFIAGINKIKIPDWVPSVGGKGFNIAKIPKLAQGSVVPPNKEFLAVLGDNTKEHEVVSPISTMKQAFVEAMQDVGAVGQPTKEEHYYLGETELMSVIYRLARGGERLNGTNLVVGGSY